MSSDSLSNDGAAEGDADAFEKLFHQYSQRLIDLAQHRIGPRLGGRLDGEDVVQSAFRTFFRRAKSGSFQIDSSGDLWKLLVSITLRKVFAKARFHTAAKRAVAAETPADAISHLLTASEPGPEEAVAFADEVQSLLKGLPDIHAEILRRRFAGETAAEIAAALEVSRQTIYRALHLLQSRLERQP